MKSTGDPTSIPISSPSPIDSLSGIVRSNRPVATVALTDGAATVTLPAVQRSTTLTALYTGDGGYAPTLTVGVLRVR